MWSTAEVLDGVEAAHVLSFTRVSCGTLMWRLNTAGMELRMAKRDNGTTRANGGTTTTNASGTPTASKKGPAVVVALERTEERSGGMVDARGKKHRKPMPSDPGANLADSQAAKLRTAKTMVKTNRRRGRG